MAKKSCSVEGCDRTHCAKGWCKFHWERVRRTGEPGPVGYLPKGGRVDITEKCSVDGCDRTIRPRGGRGMCSMHYQRYRKTGDPGPAQTYRPRVKVCGVEGCGRPFHANGMCSYHDYRTKKYGDPLGERKAVPPKVCSIEGCGLPHVAQGWCRRHYSRWGRTGDPGPAGLLKAPNGTGFLDSNGYRRVSQNGRTRLEHHVVMERVLGRPLQPFENIHHINGIRDDNRPENLELWTKPQPNGQRPEDLAEWVVENYPELVEAALASRRQLRLVI